MVAYSLEPFRAAVELRSEVLNVYVTNHSFSWRHEHPERTKVT